MVEFELDPINHDIVLKGCAPWIILKGKLQLSPDPSDFHDADVDLATLTTSLEQVMQADAQEPESWKHWPARWWPAGFDGVKNPPPGVKVYIGWNPNVQERMLERPPELICDLTSPDDCAWAAQRIITLIYCARVGILPPSDRPPSPTTRGYGEIMSDDDESSENGLTHAITSNGQIVSATSALAIEELRVGRQWTTDWSNGRPIIRITHNRDWPNKPLDGVIIASNDGYPFLLAYRIVSHGLDIVLNDHVPKELIDDFSKLEEIEIIEYQLNDKSEKRRNYKVVILFAKDRN